MSLDESAGSCDFQTNQTLSRRVVRVSRLPCNYYGDKTNTASFFGNVFFLEGDK